MKEPLEKEQTETASLLNQKVAPQNRLIGDIRDLNGTYARIEEQKKKERKRKLKLKEEADDETAKKQKL